MSLVRSVYAAQNQVPNFSVQPDLGFSNIQEAVNMVINLILAIGIALTIIFIIWGGIQYVTSKGDQKATEAARQTLTNAVIGFIIVIGVFVLRTILLGALGAENTEVANVINF